VPEATPVHEAAQLQEDLRRAGIEPFAWVVNQRLTHASITDPVLRERGAREQPYLTEVREQLAHRVAWVPWYPRRSAARTCWSSCADERNPRSRR
jgi:arsenite-transporting ATPase